MTPGDAVQTVAQGEKGLPESVTLTVFSLVRVLGFPSVDQFCLDLEQFGQLECESPLGFILLRMNLCPLLPKW